MQSSGNEYKKTKSFEEWRLNTRSTKENRSHIKSVTEINDRKKLIKVLFKEVEKKSRYRRQSGGIQYMHNSILCAKNRIIKYNNEMFTLRWKNNMLNGVTFRVSISI